MEEEFRSGKQSLIAFFTDLDQFSLNICIS